MGLVKRTGTYLARPASWAVKAEEGKCPRLAMVFSCHQYRNAGEWEPVADDQKITGFFTLFNKDGGPNEINLRALHDALGWDGSSVSSLESGDWSEREVQIVVDEHEYNGETSLEVRYLNPRDYAGGSVQKADPQVIQSLDQKYGATLRALFNAKKPANGAVAKTPAVTLPETPDGAKQLTWQAFINKTPEYTPGQRVESFKKVIAETLPVGKDPKTCTAGEWDQIRESIERDFDPATGSLIPF